MNKFVARCVRCNNSFTLEEIQNVTRCPICSTASLPADPEEDVTINVNVHELRILCIWAENYASTLDHKQLDNPDSESSKELVNLIAQRIYNQIPKEKQTPLTLSAEMLELVKSYPNATLYRNGHEEI